MTVYILLILGIKASNNTQQLLPYAMPFYSKTRCEEVKDKLEKAYAKKYNSYVVTCYKERVIK